MRELIFNDACLPSRRSLQELQQTLSCMIEGVASLLDEKVAARSIRMQKHFHEYVCNGSLTLWDVIIALRKDQKKREKLQLFLGLVQKVPLLSELSEDVVSKFKSCSPNMPAQANGDGLVLCAHTDAIAVSMRTAAAWSLSQLEITYDEMDQVGDIISVEQTIDHLAILEHAAAIVGRHRKSLRSGVNLINFWKEKEAAFPFLVFLDVVEEQLKNLDQGYFDQVVRRLSELEEAVEVWKIAKGPAPIWKSKVTPESASRLQNPKIAEQLTFQSNGEKYQFHWHARYGSSGRVYFRIDAQMLTLEIAIIGMKVV